MYFKKHYLIEKQIFSQDALNYIRNDDNVPDYNISKDNTKIKKNKKQDQGKNQTQKIQDTLKSGNKDLFIDDYDSFTKYEDWGEGFRNVFNTSITQYGTDDARNKFLIYAKQVAAKNPYITQLGNNYYDALMLIATNLNDGSVKISESNLKNSPLYWLFEKSSFIADNPEDKIEMLLAVTTEGNREKFENLKVVVDGIINRKTMKDIKSFVSGLMKQPATKTKGSAGSRGSSNSKKNFKLPTTPSELKNKEKIALGMDKKLKGILGVNLPKETLEIIKAHISVGDTNISQAFNRYTQSMVVTGKPLVSLNNDAQSNGEDPSTEGN